MIGYLRGTARDGGIVVTDGGVGYVVHCPERLRPGDDVELLVHTVVRENDISLYGFARACDQQMFVQLCKVPKVGPSTALCLLRDVGAAAIVAAKNADDADVLTAAAGVGKKSAAAILSQLEVPEALAAELRNSDDAPAEPAAAGVVGALVGLGYNPSEAQAAAAHALRADPGGDLQAHVRAALRTLARPA